MATPVHRQTRSHSSSKYGLDPVITMSQLASQLGTGGYRAMLWMLTPPPYQ
jgi:hypothetical protein